MTGRPIKTSWALKDRDGLVIAPRCDRPSHLAAYAVMSFDSRTAAREYAKDHFPDHCRPQPVQIAIDVQEIAR